MTQAYQRESGTRYLSPAGPIACTPTAEMYIPAPVHIRRRGPCLGPLQFRSTNESPVVLERLSYKAVEKGWFDGLLGGSLVAAGGVAAADDEDMAMTRRELLAGSAALVGVAAATGPARADTATATMQLRQNPGFDLAIAPSIGAVIEESEYEVHAAGDEIATLAPGEPATIPSDTTGRVEIVADGGWLPDFDIDGPIDEAQERLDSVEKWIDAKIEKLLD